MSLLAGRVAVVTGGGQGIGRGHCLHLAQAGAAVLVNDVAQAAAQGVVDEIRAAGGKASASPADITSRAAVREMLDQCRDSLGPVDILVNNAGNLRDRSFLKMSDEEFDSVWSVHVKGTFICSQLAALEMRELGRGVIINTTSGAHFGSFGQTNYAAAKGAIASMTYTWAIELARYGIRVNAIGPMGATQMSDTYRDADGKPGLATQLDPALNGPMVVYLASDEAANVSGQIFGTGGQRLSHMVQPHYGKTLIQPGGWTLEGVREHFQTHMPGEFGPFGILGKPYPFHDGVHSREPEGEGRS
jgi:NAD(P)-dependent dehydrogenase (short-subunit alcohol dehydrogenase family)